MMSRTVPGCWAESFVVVLRAFRAHQVVEAGVVLPLPLHGADHRVGLPTWRPSMASIAGE